MENERLTSFATFRRNFQMTELICYKLSRFRQNSCMK